MSVAPEYLSAALTAIAERHGTIDAYLEEVLGVDEDQRAAIRGQWLA
jgi:protein tyrosine/serine phosphatase